MSFRYLLCADIILLIISFHSNKDRCYQLDIAERETESRKRSPAHQVWLDFQVHILNPKLYCFPQVPLFCTYDIPARACALLRHERDELGSLKCSLVSWRSFAEHAANGPTLGGSFFFWVPNARTGRLVRKLFHSPDDKKEAWAWEGNIIEGLVGLDDQFVVSEEVYEDISMFCFVLFFSG